EGRWRGSGEMGVQGGFYAKAKRPRFDVDARIDDTDLRALNDLLRTYGKFDVAAGAFSFYSQIQVQEGAVHGYVKPLFKDMEVYNAAQDRDKPFLKKLYEGVVGGVSRLLENRQREEVATKVDISGTIDRPDASALEIIGGLIQNAFFRAILPGFDREIRLPRR